MMYQAATVADHPEEIPRMTSRPRLVRSIPFWILLVGSLAATVLGGALSFTKITAMIVGLDAQTATTAEVYGGQSWIVIGAALLAAGLVGLVATLSLAVIRSLLATAPAEVEQVDDVAVASDDLPFVEVPAAAQQPHAESATPVPAEESPVAAPAASEDVADGTTDDADPYAADFTAPEAQQAERR
jgi:hypothetical protein